MRRCVGDEWSLVHLCGPSFQHTTQPDKDLNDTESVLQKRGAITKKCQKSKKKFLDLVRYIYFLLTTPSMYYRVTCTFCFSRVCSVNGSLNKRVS